MMEAVSTIEAGAGITVSQANGDTAILVEGVSVQTDRVEFLDSSANGHGQLMHGEDNRQEPKFGVGEGLKGRQLRKKFGRKFFTGTVVDFEPDTNWYKVHYEDGDSEELDWAELEPLLVSEEPPPKSKKRQGVVATPKSGKKSRKTKQLELLNQEALPTGQIDLNEAVQDISQNGISVQNEDKDMQEAQAPDGGEVVEAEENEGEIHNQENIVVETTVNSNREADQHVADQDEKKSRAGRRKTGHSKKVRKPTAKSRTPKVQKVEESEEPPKEVKAESKFKTPTKKSTTPPETELSSTPRKSKRKMEVTTPASEVISPAANKKKRKSEDGATPRGRKPSRRGAGSPAKSPRKQDARNAAAKGKRIQKTPSEETKEQDDAGSRFSLVDRGVKLKGRKLRKDFDGALYNGEITGYNRRTRYYKIQYEDGDEEEMEWRELEPLLVPLEEEFSSSSAEAGTSRHSLVKTTVKVVTTVKKSTVVKQKPVTRSSQMTRRMRWSATSVS